MQVAVDTVLAQRERLVRAGTRASFWGSLLVHGLIVGVGIVAPLLAAQRETPLPEFVPVQIVPARALGVSEPTPTPRPAPPAPSRPEPEPEPETPQPPEEAKPVEPAPEPAMAPPETRRREPPKPQPAPPRPAARGELGRRQGSPTGSSTGTSAFGADVSFADQNFTYSYYIDQMLAMIQSQWQRPALGAPVEAAVFFRIRRDGQIGDLRILDSSGYNVFDLAGLRAVQQAAPFPRLPVSYPRNELAVKLILR